MRIRTIKPEFFTHEGLHDAERETKMPLRVAFVGLWCACDRSGRFKWEPRRLGIAILPYDECDFSRVLDALLTRAFIVKYRVAEAWFGAIPSWDRHQVINNRESASCIPDITEAEEVDESVTREPRVNHACQGEGKGREGERKEGEAEGADRNGVTARTVTAKAVTVIPLLLSTDEFSAAWRDWLQHRKEIKHPITPGSQTERGQLKQLEAWGETRAIAAIRHTIFKGWQGIKEPEPERRPSPNTPTGHGPLGLAPMR